MEHEEEIVRQIEEMLAKIEQSRQQIENRMDALKRSESLMVDNLKAMYKLVTGNEFEPKQQGDD